MHFFQKHPALRKLLTALAINTVIGLGMIVAAGGKHVISNIVYSQCIGLSIWSLINLLHRLFVTDQTRQWPRLLLVAPLGVVTGVFVGAYAGDFLLGGTTNVWPDQPGRLLGTLAFSLLVGAAITYFFLSREQLAKVRENLALASARAEAAQRHAAQAQLKLLETQLEPHMLFNTLSNLRILVGTDTRRAQEMLDHLVAYLRATLGASRASTLPLAAEFERLNDYLALMAIRMGPRLHCSFELPEALREQPVPGLLLQAIVENSIKHGLEPKVQGGSIHISASAGGQTLTLRVQDSGVGMPEDTGTPPPAPDSGFGLTQVRERLHTTYGERATLALQAVPGGGTLTTITLPLQA
jgi:LytS/YehU family sensor histidine kinase